MSGEGRATGGRDRERFFALLERELADEAPPSREERDFLARMESVDPECASFARAIAGMRRTDPVPAGAIERAIEEHRGAGRRAGRRVAVACGAAIAVAASAALVLVLGRSPGGEREAEGRPLPPAFALAERGGGRVGVGEPFSSGGAPRLLEAPGSLTVGVDRDSGIEVVAAAEERVSVRLDRGRAAFRLRPGAARGLTVVTPLCDVVVTGTVFSVSVEPDEVSVGVVRGKVLIRRRDGGSSSVGAGERLSVRGGALNVLDTKEAEEILSLLDISAPAPAPAPARVADTETSGDEGAPAVGAGPRAAKGEPGKPSRTGTGASAGEPVGPAAVAATPSELIREARERVRARDWRGAAELYRRIVREFPGRPEAVTVRVSLAGIELDHLGDPASALADYRGYLRGARDGALAEDALWGTGVAHARLGQFSEEKRVLEEFVRRFPQSTRSGAAQDRLIVLENRLKSE